MYRLTQGLTLQQVADEFEVHLNSVENCASDGMNLVWSACSKAGTPTGRRNYPRRNDANSATWRDTGGTARTLQHQWECGGIRRSAATASKGI